MVSRSLLVCASGVLLIGGATAGASPMQYDPGVFAGTGPYRRVFAATGYSYMSASVYLPSTPAIHLVGTDGDTPYVYTGGWGASGNDAVDAGFQYSPTYNNWSLFLSVSDGQATSDSGSRFASGQTVTLQFGATATTGGDATLQISAQGKDVSGNSISRVLTVSNVPYWGVSAGNGALNDTLKRMTSIAQNTENFRSGSYINGVDWSNSTIGDSAATAVSWLGAEQPTTADAGYQSYTSSVVSVNFVNAGNETDSIALPEPATGAIVAAGLTVFGLTRRGRSRPT